MEIVVDDIYPMARLVRKCHTDIVHQFTSNLYEKALRGESLDGFCCNP
jgi:hypothetical protein